MNQCFNLKPEERPDFQQIYGKLQQMATL